MFLSGIRTRGPGLFARVRASDWPCVSLISGRSGPLQLLPPSSALPTFRASVPHSLVPQSREVGCCFVKTCRHMPPSRPVVPTTIRLSSYSLTLAVLRSGRIIGYSACKWATAGMCAYARNVPAASFIWLSPYHCRSGAPQWQPLTDCASSPLPGWSL